jgi:Ca2+-binding RTX toxin-like protein
MANANYAPTVAGTVLTGTSGDDTISIDPAGATGGVTVNAGAGTDTVIFDGELAAAAAAGVFAATGINVFDYSAPTATFTVGAYEFLTFDNGTVSSNASVTPEQILADSISASITVLGDDADTAPGVGLPLDFNLSAILDWNGSAAATNAGWTIQSIEGQASSAGAFITIVEGGEVQGRVAVNAANNGIDVTAENAFHSSITEIGATKTMEIDVVLEKGTDTFAETLSVDVVGVASGANNTFNGTAAGEGAFTATGIIDGLGGDDVLIGNGGNDFLFGEAGNDRLWAGLTDDGNDISIGGNGDDKVGGGVGDDILVGDGHVGTVAATTFGALTDDGVDDLFGADGDDIVVGGTISGVDINGFTPPSGVTPILTAGGVLAGGVTIGGTAGDKLWAGAGDDQVIGAGGNDRIGLGDGADIANAGAGNDEIFSGAGDDDVMGAAGDDEIYGGAGDDDLQGGVGADTIYGGTGDDDLYGNDTTIAADTAVDTFAFETGDGNDTIWDFEDGVDLIDLSALGITSLNELVTENQGAGNDFVIFYGQTDSITLDGMGSTAPAPAIITDADFIFA